MAQGMCYYYVFSEMDSGCLGNGEYDLELHIFLPLPPGSCSSHCVQSILHLKWISDSNVFMLRNYFIKD